MLAERDLAVDTELPAEILQARKKNENAYDATQEELSKLNTVKDAAHIVELLSHLRDLGAEREQLIDSVRKSSPRYATLRYPHPLNVSETRDALDRGTILATFTLSNDRTVPFVTQTTGVESGVPI